MSHEKHLGGCGQVKLIGLMKGKTRVLFQLLRIDFPMALITLIGLTIALSISAATLIYLDSKKPEVYMSIFENEDFEEDLRFHGNRHQLSAEIFTNFSELKAIQEALDNQLDEYKLGDIFSPSSYSPYYMIGDQPTYFLGIALDHAVLEDCIEGSSLPSLGNETIIFNPHDTNMSIGEVFNVTYTEFQFDVESDQVYRFDINYTMKITGIITPSTLRAESPLQHVFPENSFDFLPIVEATEIPTILDSIEQELIFKIFEAINKVRSDLIPAGIHFIYALNKANIRPNNVVEIITNYNAFLRTTGSMFDLDGAELVNPEYYTTAPIVQELITDFNSSFFLFLILGIPTFILIFLLVKFSLNLINTPRKKSIALCKMRAVSRNFILISLVIELVLVSFLGSITGITIGIPLFLLMNTTTGFLTFELTEIPPRIVLSLPTVQTICVMSLVLTFLSQSRQILSLSRAKMISFRQVMSPKKDQKDGRLRGNLDVFLLIQGGLGVVIFTWLVDILFQNVELFGNFTFFLLILMILSALAFILGGVLTLQRFIPTVIQQSGIFFWKRNWRQLAFAARNLSSNMRLSERTTLLMAISLSFLMILSSLPMSYYEYHIDNTYYSSGSDWAIYTPDVAQNPDTIAQLRAIPGINVTQVGYRWQYRGIEEDFAQSAHWQDYYDDSSLQELVLALFSSSADFPAIISSKFASQEKLSLGDNFRGLEEKELTVEGISNYWPSTSPGDFVITPLRALANMTEHLDYYLWVKFLAGHNQTSLVSETRKIIGSISFESSYPPVRARLGELETTNYSTAFIWVIINFNFLAALTVALSVIILFSLARIVSTAPEIGLSRALGMKYQQLFLLTLMEPFLLFFLSGIPGAIIGLTLLGGFVFILGTFPIPGPPFILKFNYPVIFLLYSEIFFVTLVIGALSSSLAMRVNIARILQVE
ncbi:MAG: FtsX-like permease family protein [Candidatus Thorarchaeota archaeon]